MTEKTIELEDLLDQIEAEDLAFAIEYLKKKEDIWQDYLSMPSN